MNASECVRSIKALKHYKRYRSAMIASVLALSGIVFFGGESEAMFKSSASLSRSPSPVRSNQGAGLQRSTTPGSGRQPRFSSTKVLGSQDFGNPDKVTKVMLSKLEIMKRESKSVSIENDPGGIMHRNVPIWSWSETVLEALQSEGRIKYSKNSNGNYDILILH